MEKTEYIKANSVAFSGHRTIAENCKDEIRKKLRSKIRLLYAMGFTNFFCGMALGFDMLAAEEVISLKAELPKLKLIAVIPFEGQSERWSTREQDRYKSILAKADDSILLCRYYFKAALSSYYSAFFVSSIFSILILTDKSDLYSVLDGLPFNSSMSVMKPMYFSKA